MIDLQKEKVIGLHEAAQRVPAYRPGKPCHVSALSRWITHGCLAMSGQMVRLEAVRLGHRWVTSIEALQRFADALTQGVGQERAGTEMAAAAQR